MNTKILFAAVLIVSVTLSGCVPRGDTVRIEFNGSFDVTESGFHMEGYLTTEGGIPDQDSYRDITARFYTRNGRLLHEEALGDLGADEQLNVTVSLSEVPHYVIFESPDFWQESMGVEYYERTDSGYTVSHATSPSELPENTTVG